MHPTVARPRQGEPARSEHECLAEDLRAAKLQLTQAGRQLELNTDGMSPLQLSAKRGLRFMYQHIMKREHTIILWTWGPVTQYQINLDGIDSSGEGASDVMEILTREDAALVTKEFILDDFMAGFMHTLFRQKWCKFGLTLHIILSLLDAAVVAIVFYLCVAVKQEVGVKQLHLHFSIMLTLLAIFLGVEALFGYLFASNIRTKNITSAVLLHRTWSWMQDFSVGTNLLAAALLSGAATVYFLEPEHADIVTSWALHHVANFGRVAAAMHGAVRGRALEEGVDWEYVRRLKDGAAGDGDEPPAGLDWHYIHDTAETEAERVSALYQYNLDSAEEAAWDGIEPLSWLLLGLGFLLKFYAFVDSTVRPFTTLSIFLLSIRQVIKGQLLIFQNLFLLFTITFVVTMITIYPDHHAKGKLPQAPELLHWIPATYAIMMAGFTGEPLDLNLHPDFLVPLGPWQKINMVTFFCIYILYLFLSLILLLNLLIALLASTFAQTQNEATLQGRMAFARIVLRLERLAEIFGIDTWAGSTQGESHVYEFRDVVRDKEGEHPRYAVGENIFDEKPADNGNDVEPSGGSARPERDAKASVTNEGLQQLKSEIVQQLRAEMAKDLKAALKEERQEAAAARAEQKAASPAAKTPGPPLTPPVPGVSAGTTMKLRPPGAGPPSPSRACQSARKSSNDRASTVLGQTI